MIESFLLALIEKFDGGPVGVENLAAAIGEERDTIEDVIEPYLIQQGLLQRTPRGRVLASAGYAYLGLDVPATLAAQLDLLTGNGSAGDAEEMP